MQTFIPIATTEYKEIAKVLDNLRLNKQALEGWQIMMTLLELDPQGNHRKPKGWVNHPAVKMWRGHESELLVYVSAMVDEWLERGFKSTIGTKAFQTYIHGLAKQELPVGPPSWMLNQQQLETVAATHRLALLTKNYSWYSQFNWPEDTGVAPTEYTYKWPIN